MVLSPSVFQKSFNYKFKTVTTRLFVALKELVEVLVLDNVSYLWKMKISSFNFASFSLGNFSRN